ncbi:unnamed protein product [Durusdinium trenchii]|uniref:Phosphoglycerate kinase n=2 Tax=Durusdinium trenchii TaxID=1381693 RepID=A0ABP0LRJ9_9DINO
MAAPTPYPYQLPQTSSMVVGSPYAAYSSPYASVDHSQGKWFAPGEALPPGFIAMPHPDGHAEPQAHHAVSDAVKSAMPGLVPEVTKVASAATKKRSKKKKSSGCC